jgi:mono/diheme cytochrome c family protein
LAVRRIVFLLAWGAVAASLVAATSSLAATHERSSTPSASSADGRTLYRKFCGQCHALKAAKAVGFGTKKGLGALGGPSFDELRIPYAMNVRHVTQPTGGHEIVRKKITAKELHVVAAFIAKVTKGNPIPALPTDG